MSRTAAIALGSNLGNRAARLAYAVARLKSLLSDVAVSTSIENPPEHGVLGPPFLNGVLVGRTDLSARALLAILLEIEKERGRERGEVGAPRTLDLDLVLLGDLVLDEPGLQVPHPRFRTRTFVLGPLAEVAPTLTDPMTGVSIERLLAKLSR